MKLSVVLVAAALAFSSCNCFKKMAKNRDDINLTVKGTSRFTSFTYATKQMGFSGRNCH